MPTKFEIVIENNRFVRREIIEESLGSCEAVLGECVAQSNLCLNNLVPFGDKGMTLLVSPTQTVLISELAQIPFKTYFEPNDQDGRTLVPVYRPHRGALLLNVPFKFPADFGGKILLAARFPVNPNTPPADTGKANFYLWLYMDGELWHFGYPNIFGDGRVCMGHDYERAKATGKGFIAEYLTGQQSFFESQMNDHLMTAGSSRMFRMSLDEKWLPPPPKQECIDNGWITKCSTAFMEGFKL